MAQTPIWKKLFSFRGRAPRREFILVFGMTVVVGGLLGATPATPASALPILMLMLVAGVIQLAVVARRLHDVGRSGWWQLPPNLLAMMAILPMMRAGALDPQAKAPLTVVVAMLLCAAFMIALAVARGDKGANRFGDPPA